METVNILGLNITKASMKELLDIVFSSKKAIIANISADSVYKSYKDPELLSKVNKLPVIVTDDELLQDAARTLSGVDLPPLDISNFIDNVIKNVHKNSMSLYLLGGSAGVALKAKKAITAKYRGFNIVEIGTDTYDETKYADIILLDLPFGTREDFLLENIKKLNAKTVIAFSGCLSYIARLEKKVPNWYRHLRLEKLYKKLNNVSSMDDVVFIPHFKKAVLKQKQAQKGNK